MTTMFLLRRYHHHLQLLYISAFCLIAVTVDVKGKESLRPFRHHKLRIEIPADSSLFESGVPEELEQKLGKEAMTGPLGRKKLNNRIRKRRQGDDGSDTKSNMEDEAITNRKDRTFNQNEVDTGDDDNALELLKQLQTLQEDIDNRIQELQMEMKKGKRDRSSKLLVRATRELMKRAEVTKRKKRSTDEDDDILVPYKACIVIDVPGTTDEEIEPLSIQTIERKPKPICPQIQPEQSVRNENSEQSSGYVMQSRSYKKHSEPEGIQEVYWLKTPSEENQLANQRLLNNLYATVDRLHQEGKDILFIPISTGYMNPEEVKNGFIKSLDIIPSRRHLFDKLQIKEIV